jgi:transposase
MTADDSCSLDWKELRRRRALVLKRRGWKQQEIAEALAVTPAAVSKWMRLVRAQGEAALAARPHLGAATRLSEDQRSLIPDLLAHGAEAYGFRGEVWTCARVAELIRREFSVSYHRATVSRLLKALAWTPQKPGERAAQRDEAAIAAWRAERWPALKKRPGARGALSSWWMSRAFTCCRV